MMWRITLAAFLTICLALFQPASRAQFNGCKAGFCAPVVVGGGGYTGPGDVRSFSLWVGLRAYNASIASAGTQKIVNVRNTSTAETCDILVSSGGGGTLGNTANCSGSSSGLSPATFCAGGGGTCAIATWYDQSGNGCNMTQSTAANQPILNLSGGPFTGLLTNYAAFSSSTMNLGSTGCTPPALPASLYVWGLATAHTAENAFVATASFEGYGLVEQTSSDLGLLFAGVNNYSCSTLAMTDSTWYLASIYITAAAGTLSGTLQSAGGSQSTQANCATVGTPSANFQYSIANQNNPLAGRMTEAGIATSQLTSGNMTTIYNQH